MAASARAFSSLTRWPTSRFAVLGAAFSQVSLTCVSTPFLRAIQRSRKVFQSDSLLQRGGFGVERGEQVGDGAIERVRGVVVEFGNGVHDVVARVPLPKGLRIKMYRLPSAEALG